MVEEEEVSGSRALDQTPTWAVAAVCAIIIVISIGLEKALHWFTEVKSTRNAGAFLSVSLCLRLKLDQTHMCLMYSKKLKLWSVRPIIGFYFSIAARYSENSLQNELSLLELCINWETRN